MQLAHRTGCMPAARAAPRRLNAATPRPSVVRAQASTAADHSNSVETRVLRYPNGMVRSITYPVPADESDLEGWSEDVGDDWDQSQDWQNFDECNLFGASCNPALLNVPDVTLEEVPQASRSSFLTFEEELAAQAAALTERVNNSYQVLRGSPWLLPKPLYTLATELSMHCLPVRFQRTEVQEELAMVLKKPELAEMLTFSEVKDGVVAFETPVDAARYATALEADLDLDVNVVGVDSHKLFLNTNDVDGCVVYLRGDGSFVPMPYQLAQALRTNSAS